MAKRTILFLAVVAFCAFTVSVFATDYSTDYWTWTHTFLPIYKITTNGTGFYPYYAPNVGQLNPAYGDYNQQNTIQTSPADDTAAQTYRSVSNAAGVLIRPDGFSYNNDINGWLADPEHALLFSVSQNYRYVPDGGYYSETTDGETITTTTTADGSGLDTGAYQQYVGRVIVNPNPPPTYLQTNIPNVMASQWTSNDDVRVINATGWEVLVQHAEAQDWAVGTLGVVDLAWTTPTGGTPYMAGRLSNQIEYAMGDFDVTASEPDPNEMIYFSAGRYIQSVYMTNYMKMTRPNATWLGGSDYLGSANAGDVLTTYIDPDSGSTQYGVFEKAYKIAGCMLGDQFWTVGGGSLKWNTWFCWVSTSTSSLSNVAVEAAGHTTVRNFMRYVFDITALKVQDFDEDGMFDVGYDKILFSVMSDLALNRARNYADQWDCDALFAGQFFDGDTIFLYDGISVTTYMDRSHNLFYGQVISTGTATIWGDKFGDYNLTGFDLTHVPIPEPSTMILIAGATLALGAGILRKKVR